MTSQCLTLTYLTKQIPETHRPTYPNQSWNQLELQRGGNITATAVTEHERRA